MKKILVNISLAMLAVGGMTSCSDILDKEVDLTYTTRTSTATTTVPVVSWQMPIPICLMPLRDIPMVSSVQLLVTV